VTQTPRWFFRNCFGSYYGFVIVCKFNIFVVSSSM